MHVTETPEKKSTPLERPTGKIHLVPLDRIAGYDVRPGFYEINGATAIPCGVNFTVHSTGATSCELLLFGPDQFEPFAILKIPEHYRIGHVYSIIVFGLNIHDFEYAYRLDGPNDPQKGVLFNKKACLLDPYAKAVAGQRRWGTERSSHFYKARVVEDDFDWGDHKKPQIPMEDLIIYELHVRGFTQHASSGVSFPGTFAGLAEKIPYLKDLGVNAVELMPIFEFDESRGRRQYDGGQLYDYWGYNPVCFFAPNTSYTAVPERNREGRELKQLISAFSDNGIEVILDVVFNHTSEGNEHGPFFSFKGFDNNIYYMLTPDGHYYNFSGCGNTLNCNHPVVQQMILECLRYWTINYRVDGFRFDLASILGRNEDGSPMNKPPLLQALAFDPILGKVKLIAEAWDAGGLYQVGSFPSWNRWAEWNGKYRDDMRAFLKGDSGLAAAAAHRIAGSPDLYTPGFRDNASVNFMTCHDGFTLYDLYSYSQKHNKSNGWDNTDGHDDNKSWNCGVEGAAASSEVIVLRKKLIKNALAVLLCSRGTPMLLAGDEFCNTQYGNNNPYCQDNEISWLNWDDLNENRDIFDFLKHMVAFRKKHPAISKNLSASACGFPGVSFHGERAWQLDENCENHTVGVMFAGRTDVGRDDVVFIAVNAYWESKIIYPPQLPYDLCWRVEIDTARPNSFDPHGEALGVINEGLKIFPRSVCVLTAGFRK